jgi:predicted amidophosphoribosyltransferase
MCSACGSSILPDQNFCTQCGKDLRGLKTRCGACGGHGIHEWMLKEPSNYCVDCGRLMQEAHS